jgi:hypothetical protein
MDPFPPLAGSDRKQPDKAMFWLTIVAAGLWALVNATLCHAVFEFSAHPGPTGPNAGPLPASVWHPVILILTPLSLVLSVAPPLALLTGLRYLRSADFTSRPWLTAWGAAVAAALAVEAVMLRATIRILLPGGSLPGPRPVDNGPKELAFGFVATGLALLVVLIVAIRSAGAAAKLPVPVPDNSTTG